MKNNPLRDPLVLTDLERRGAVLEQSSTAGKMTVDLNLKDGRWSVGNVAITFPRRHGEKVLDHV